MLSVFVYSCIILSDCCYCPYNKLGERNAYDGGQMGMSLYSKIKFAMRGALNWGSPLKNSLLLCVTLLVFWTLLFLKGLWRIFWEKDICPSIWNRDLIVYQNEPSSIFQLKPNYSFLKWNLLDHFVLQRMTWKKLSVYDGFLVFGISCQKAFVVGRKVTELSEEMKAFARKIR